MRARTRQVSLNCQLVNRGTISEFSRGEWENGHSDPLATDHDPITSNNTQLKGGGGGVQGKFFWRIRFELWAP